MSKFESELSNMFDVLELYYNNKEILLKTNFKPFYWGDELIYVNKNISKYIFLDNLIKLSDCILYDSWTDMRELFNTEDLIYFFNNIQNKKTVEYKIDSDGENISLDEEIEQIIFKLKECK